MVSVSVHNMLKDVAASFSMFLFVLSFIAGLHVTSRRPCWWSRTKAFSPLGTKLYFQVNSSRKYSFVLTPNMAALSRGCKPRIHNRQPVSMHATQVTWDHRAAAITVIFITGVMSQGQYSLCFFWPKMRTGTSVKFSDFQTTGMKMLLQIINYKYSEHTVKALCN